MRIRRRTYDDPLAWEETLIAARAIIAGYRRMGEDPHPILLRMVGDINDKQSDPEPRANCEEAS